MLHSVVIKFKGADDGFMSLWPILYNSDVDLFLTFLFLNVFEFISFLYFLLPGGAVSASAEFSSSLRFSFGRMASVSAFNVSSDANEMLKGLRYFEKTSKTDPTKKPMSWGIVRINLHLIFLKILINY